MSARPVKHSVTLRGHRTSISLEDEFWQELRDLAQEMDMPINALVAQIDAERGVEAGLVSIAPRMQTQLLPRTGLNS